MEKDNRDEILKKMAQHKPAKNGQEINEKKVNGRTNTVPLGTNLFSNWGKIIAETSHPSRGRGI